MTPAFGMSPTAPSLKSGFEDLSAFRSDAAIEQFCALLRNTNKRLSEPKSRLLAAQLYGLIGQSFLIDENDVPAEHCFYIASTLDPADKTYKAFRADTLFRSNRAQEAEAIAAELSPAPGDSLKVYEIVAVTKMKNGGIDGYRSVMDKAIGTASNTGDWGHAYAVYGRTLLRNGYPDLAEDFYTKAVGHTSSPYMQKIYSAIAKLCKQKMSAAHELYVEAGKLMPNDPSWYYGMAITPLEHSNERAELRLLKKAVACPRFSSTILVRLADRLESLKRDQEAFRALDYLNKNRPWAADGKFAEGMIYKRHHQFKEAETEFQACIDLNARNTAAYIQLGNTYADAGEINKARQVYEKGSTASPSARIFLQYGTFELAQKNPGKADQLFGQALRRFKDPDHANVAIQNDVARAHAAIGAHAYSLGKKNVALGEAYLYNKYKFVPVLGPPFNLLKLRPEHLDFKSLDNDPHLKAAYDHAALGDMLYEAKQLDDSVAEYRLAIAEDPEEPDLHTFLMTALTEKNDWFAAASEDVDLSRKLMNRIPSAVDRVAKRLSNKS